MKSLSQWQKWSEKRLITILKRPAMRKLLKASLPKDPTRKGALPRGLHADLSILSAPVMKKMNGEMRGKPYATDVLSFPAPEVFQKQGVLGELLICAPVLERQARELGHSAELECEILLVHGVLHLLGFDHEKGPKKAREMARAEALVLGKRALGLIDRS